MDNSFSTSYSGSFKGLINKELFDSFLNNINTEQQWLEVVITSHDYELHTIKNNEVKKHIQNYINKIEEKGHHSRYDWFYTDTVESPRMIKVYNPLLCGCSGGEPPAPWLIFTTFKPDDDELKIFRKDAEKTGLKEKVLCKIRGIKSMINQ